MAGDKSLSHCTKCGGLIALKLDDPIAYAYDNRCVCPSKQYGSDLATVNADDRELSPCNNDSNISIFLEVYLALIPCKILAKRLLVA